MCQQALLRRRAWFAGGFARGGGAIVWPRTMTDHAWLLAVVTAAAAALPVTNAVAKIAQIRQVVVIVQENRTPDNLFGAFKAELPGADLSVSGMNALGEVVPLTPVPLAHGYDLDHSHHAFVQTFDNGRLDGANLIKCTPPNDGVCPPNAPYRYVNGPDVMPYFEIARNYGFANRMFQTNQGPSFPAHQFLFAGTSQLTATSNLFASDNPTFSSQPVGCAGLPEQTVSVIGPSGETVGAVFPCFEHQTLSDVLDQHSPPISWRYYTPSAGSIWTAPNAIRHICQPSQGSCEGPEWTNGSVILNPPQVLQDIAANRLATVSWVIPNGYYSDHAGGSISGEGPSWVADIVDAIGNSPYWNSTAILITWDDWGGWYDHVKPPTGSGRPFGYYELGFRVPLLVVSPYTKAGYISKAQHDFGSILRFIEAAFGLGRIPPGDFADARADNLTDFFDFEASPRAFAPIPAPLPGSYFINDARPPSQPDDD